MPNNYIILTPDNIKNDIYKIKGYSFKPDEVKVLGDPSLPWSCYGLIQEQIRG